MPWLNCTYLGGEGRTSIGFSGSLGLKKEQDQDFHEKSTQIPLIMEISKFSVKIGFRIVKNFLLIRACFLFPAANCPKDLIFILLLTTWLTHIGWRDK